MNLPYRSVMPVFPFLPMRVRVDTSNFMKAQAIMQRHSRIEPAKNLNRAVYFTVMRAQRYTPTTAISRIDTDLNVWTVPTVGKRGKLSKKEKRVVSGNYDFQSGQKSVPLAALIVQSQVLRVSPERSQPGMSRYNRLTGMRYARMFSPWKGVSRRTGASKMKSAIQRMVMARHSSGSYFKSSWSAVLNALRPFLPAGYRVKSGPKILSNLGTATPAREGTNPTCIVENLIGMDGKSAVLNERRNMAAHRILGPVMQTAIDTEFHNAMVRMTEKGWKDAAPMLKQYGVVVT